MSNTPSFTEHDTSLNLWLDDPADPAVKATHDALVDHLRGRGFDIELDQKVDPIIREGYHRGNKGALEVTIRRCGRCVELAFFQNVVRENRNGGEYDFDKRQKMPFLLGKLYELERGKIGAMMAGLGFPLIIKPKRKGMAWVDHRRAELAAFHRNHYAQPPETYNTVSAVKGVSVYDGSTVYFRSWSKRWQIGVAFHNINNMWWVLLPCGTVTNIASFDLHLTKPDANLKVRYFNDDDRKKRQMASLQRADKIKETNKIEALRAMLTPAHGFYVLSLKHTKRSDGHITLWGQSGSGYRLSIAGAGKYPREEILAHLGHYNNGENIAVDAETVERLVTMCDKTDRDIGGAAPTLRNNPHNWYRLLAATIAKPKYDVIPEILTTKSGKRRKTA